MSDLSQQFSQAQQDAMSLSSRPGNDVLLKLYALYKQGSAGDVSGKRPGMTNFKGRAKFDAWASLKGTSAEEAQRQYVALVKSLQ